VAGRERFLELWFRGISDRGREVGCPKRFYMKDWRGLPKFVNYCANAGLPCYMSVQPYVARNMLYGVERIYFDFDSQNPDVALRDARKVYDRLDSMGVRPVMLFSGRKGYHIHVFLPRVFLAGAVTVDVLKNLLKILCLEALGCRTSSEVCKKYPTLDMQVWLDVKRISRVPYSLHEKSGVECIPVDPDGKETSYDLVDCMKNPLPEDLVAEAWKDAIAMTAYEQVDEPMWRKPSNRVRLYEEAAKIIESGTGDGRKRIIFYLLVPRLILAGYGDKDIMNSCREYLERSGCDWMQYRQRVVDCIRRNRDRIARGEPILYRLDTFIRENPDLREELLRIFPKLSV